MLFFFESTYRSMQTFFEVLNLQQKIIKAGKSFKQRIETKC